MRKRIAVVLPDLAASFDGVIFAAARFHREAMRAQIAALLREKQVSCVVLDERMEGMESVFAEHEEGMYLITKHLIEEHGFRDIAFLGGVFRSMILHDHHGADR